MGGDIHNIKENEGSMEVASKEIGLELNADKSECMVMSRDQNAGRSDSIKFERNHPIVYWFDIFTLLYIFQSTQL